MHPWKVALIAVAPSSCLLILAIILIWRYYFPAAAASQNPPRQKESAGQHHVRLYGEKQQLGSANSWEYAPKNIAQMPSMWRNAAFLKPFDWANHPVLMADALERGWTAFALSYTSLPSTGASPKLWNSCTKSSHDKACVPEITWQIGPATELMQLIRFNPGLSSKDSCLAPAQILHSALPVPGPVFGTSSFPQEAYFEIIILAEGCELRTSFSYDYAEHEEVTLIPKSSHNLGHSKAASEDICLEGSGGNGKLESSKTSKLKILLESSGGPTAGGSRHDANKLQQNLGSVKGNAVHIMAVGLTVEAPPSFSLPGTYFGSVGFHSDGQMFLNGYPCTEMGGNGLLTKRRTWAAVNDTLGCGFNPRTNRVFFTLNGEHMGELICSKGDFEQSLYVAIGSNYDATVMVNFGQGPFIYAPENSQRTPDPGSWLTPSKFVRSRKVCEDSGDLFSMGRVDFSKFLGESQNVTSQGLRHQHAFSEAESDLFDIVLEGRALQ